MLLETDNHFRFLPGIFQQQFPSQREKRRTSRLSCQSTFVRHNSARNGGASPGSLQRAGFQSEDDATGSQGGKEDGYRKEAGGLALQRGPGHGRWGRVCEAVRPPPGPAPLIPRGSNQDSESHAARSGPQARCRAACEAAPRASSLPSSTPGGSPQSTLPLRPGSQRRGYKRSRFSAATQPPLPLTKLEIVQPRVYRTEPGGPR